MSGRPTAAVVGSGISGLTAAYLLQRTHDVTLFEKQDRLGGHTHTHDVAVGGGDRAGDGGRASVPVDTVPVDTGFIVHNDRTYPLLRRLFGELGVRTRRTEMSMSVTCEGCGLSYAGGRGAKGIFAQRRRVADRRFWRLLLDVRRFQRLAQAHLDEPASVKGGRAEQTFGDFLAAHGFGEYFVRHYAIPVVSCVWSTGHADAVRYPAAYLFAFLRNHGFLSLRDAPTWHTVVGGSRAYVTALVAHLDDVRISTPVVAVARKPDRVEVHDAEGGHHEYDKVVVATHADEALALLSDASALETSVLGAFGYSRNDTWLHRDATLLPRPRQARASWNYRLDDCGAQSERTQVTYWMNRLQGYPEGDPLLVTLNPDRDRPPRDLVESMAYTHPVYTPESVAAQARLPALDSGRLAFAGAYHGWGFHEDGCRAGVAAAEALGVQW